MKQSKALKTVSRICWRFLGLSLPYRVNVRDRVSVGKTRCNGRYQFQEHNRKIGPYHRIGVSTDAVYSRGLYNTLIHEFVHAWQTENGFILENHDLYFIEVAGILEAELGAVLEKELGRKLQKKIKIYFPDRDLL